MLCGISYPQSAPFSNLTGCCTGAVETYNGCFQYCPVIDRDSFGECLRTDVEVKGDGFAYTCNRAEEGVQTSAGSGGKRGRGQWTGVVMVVGLCLVQMM